MEDYVKTILQLVKKISDEELLQLNKFLFEEHKKRIEQKILHSSTQFKKGDIVTFQHNEKTFTGVIVKINPKSMWVTTIEGAQFKISPTFLVHENNPSKKARELKRRLFPTIDIVFGDKVVRCNPLLPPRKINN